MTASLLNRLQGYRVRDQAPIPPVAGKLTRVVGLTLEAIAAAPPSVPCAASTPRMGPWRPRWWASPAIASS